MAAREITTIVAELEREVRALREEVELLKAQAAAPAGRTDRFAGIFTGDEQWAAIHEAIEEARCQPDQSLMGAMS